LTIYHRWILRAQVLKGSSIKSKSYGVLIQPEVSNGNSDDKFITGLEPFTATSVEFLNSIIADPELFRMPVYDSFIPLEESSFSKNEAFNGQKFDECVIITKTQLKTQIYFDLCSYYIFTKKYELAKEMALLCKSNLESLKNECNEKLSDLSFCTVTDDDLKGYLLACGVFEQQSLLQRFNESLLNKRKNIEVILNEDNHKMEIPFVHRKCLESTLDKTAPEFLKIVALNYIRYILDDSNIITSNLSYFIVNSNTQRILLFKHCVQVFFLLNISF
jgi:integrator complex subunit 8